MELIGLFWGSQVWVNRSSEIKPFKLIWGVAYTWCIGKYVYWDVWLCEATQMGLGSVFIPEPLAFLVSIHLSPGSWGQSVAHILAPFYLASRLPHLNTFEEFELLAVFLPVGMIFLCMICVKVPGSFSPIKTLSCLITFIEKKSCFFFFQNEYTYFPFSSNNTWIVHKIQHYRES